jgi:hypothetical protein
MKNKLTLSKFRYKKVAIILLAVIMALISYKGLLSTEGNINNDKRVEALRVKERITKDSEISPEQYEIVKVDAIDGLNYATKDDVINKVIESDVYKGDIITIEKLKDKKELSEGGKVLYSLKIDPSDAVAGTLRAGDFVYISASLINGTNEVSKYLFETSSGDPEPIKINQVYDSDLAAIKDDSKVANIYLLELDSNQVPILRGAELVQKLKITTAK